MFLTLEILTRPTRKLWLNQTYQAFEVKSINQIYQKTLVKPGLPGFWGGKFQPGLPGKPGNTRLTRHFWLGFLSRDLSYQTFLVNYNQVYLESPITPGSTRLSILLVNCQKPGKSGSTMVYQAHHAFNQTFGARQLIGFKRSIKFKFLKMLKGVLPIWDIFLIRWTYIAFYHTCSDI